MKVLGITGGVGCGKSKVLTYLAEHYNAHICQLDEVAKELQKKGTSCYDKIIEEFGEKILRTDGELDRYKLGEIVFSHKEKRLKLNEIVHPEVKNWVKNDIFQKEKANIPFYVIEAALLPEAGYEDICNEFWYIYTQESIRRKRLKESRGYSDEKITNMIASQASEEVYKKTCHVVIDNSGSFEDTMKQIGEML